MQSTDDAYQALAYRSSRGDLRCYLMLVTSCLARRYVARSSLRLLVDQCSCFSSHALKINLTQNKKLRAEKLAWLSKKFLFCSLVSVSHHATGSYGKAKLFGCRFSVSAFLPCIKVNSSFRCV